MLAASILYLLAAWNIDNKVEQFNTAGSHKSAVVAADLPVHVSAEHSLKLQRFFNHTLSRIKDLPTSIESPVPIWALAPAEIIPSLVLIAVSQRHAIYVAHSIQQQLSTLNIPRAPPLV